MFPKTGSAGTLTQANGTFDISGVTVAADDTISFVVNANTNIDADETALRGTITLVVRRGPGRHLLDRGRLEAWNTLATNWKLTSNNAATQFLPNDAVFFHDSPTTAVVDISSGNVSPLAATFDNTTATAYTLQGSNGIATGTLTKSGDGSLTIPNANSTFGAVALNGGLTSLTNSGGLGSGAISFDGGALEYTGATRQLGRPRSHRQCRGRLRRCHRRWHHPQHTGTLTGAGLLTKLGAGTLVLGQTSGTVSTPLAISGGTLTLNCGAGAVTYSGDFTGSGGDLRLVGSGTLTLSGANDYTGSTTVTQGTLAVNNTSASGTGSGAVTVQSTATLAGTGSISGSVSIESGGFVAPGNAGIGTLTIASAALSRHLSSASWMPPPPTSGRQRCPHGQPRRGHLGEHPRHPGGGKLSHRHLWLVVGSLPVVTGIPIGYVLNTATAGQLKLSPLPANVTIIADIAAITPGRARCLPVGVISIQARRPAGPRLP